MLTKGQKWVGNKNCESFFELTGLGGQNICRAIKKFKAWDMAGIIGIALCFLIQMNVSLCKYGCSNI